MNPIVANDRMYRTLCSLNPSDYLHFPQKLRPQNNTTPIDPAVHLLLVIRKADLLDHRAALEVEGGAFHFQVLDDLDRIALSQRVAVAVFHRHVENSCVTGPQG